MNTPFEQYIRSRLMVGVAMLLGIVLAIWAGKMHGSGKSLQVICVFLAVASTILAIKTQKKLWILVPMFWGLDGKLTLLPLPFSVKDLIVLYVSGAIFICVALKLIRRKPTYGLLDLILLLNLVWLLTVYIRNPVGTNAMNSERVGGKPYFDVMVAVLACMIFYRSTSTVTVLRRLPFMILGVHALLALTNTLLLLVPRLIPIAYSMYTGFNVQVFVPNTTVMDGNMRYGYLVELCSRGAAVLAAYFPPLTLLNPFYWKRFSSTVLMFVGLLLSGFRSSLLVAVQIIGTSIFIRNGALSLVRLGIAVVVAVALLFLGHGTLYELPFAAQRALTSVPKPLRLSQLEPSADMDAEASVRWRLEMWHDALYTSKYIANKWLGDGFGMTRWQLYAASVLASRQQSNRETQETMAYAGQFHSGAISAIRYVGGIGLILYLTLMVGVAIKGYKLIRKTQGTPYCAPTMFFSLTLIIAPFNYIFIFGSFDGAFPGTIFGMGMLQLIDNSFDEQVVKGEIKLPAQRYAVRSAPRLLGNSRTAGAPGA